MEIILRIDHLYDYIIFENIHEKIILKPDKLLIIVNSLLN